MQLQVEKMIEKLNHLSQDRLAEVNDFIDFLKQRDQIAELRSDFSTISEASLAKIWDNDEDSIYDSL